MATSVGGTADSFWRSAEVAARTDLRRRRGRRMKAQQTGPWRSTKTLGPSTRREAPTRSFAQTALENARSASRARQGSLFSRIRRWRPARAGRLDTVLRLRYFSSVVRALESRIDTGSTRFAENRASYEGRVKTLRERQEWAISGGPGRDRSIERHLARGKVMVRDRIDLVTDDGTPFLELSTLSGFGQYGDAAPGAGIVTGIGLVHGVPYVFIANDATVKGGSLLPVSIKKHVRAQDIALENGLGVIYLVDSGGAFLPLQDDIFPDKDHFGGSFYRQARLSAAGLPQLSVVLGGCTAGGAYVPALSDEVITVSYTHLRAHET